MKKQNYDSIDITINGRSFIVYDVPSTTMARVLVKSYIRDLQSCKNKSDRDLELIEWGGIVKEVTK